MNLPDAPGTSDRAPNDDHDRLVDLVHGLLPDEERDALLQRVAADPQLEETLRAQALSVERARIAGTPALSSTAAGATAGPVASFWSRLREFILNPRPAPLIGFGLAVMFAVAVLKAPDPFESLIPALPTELEAMRLRSGESLPKGLTDGIEAYGNGQLEIAIRRLDECEATGVADLVRKAYLGSALSRSGEWNRAIEVLDEVVDRPLPAPWGEESRWARAIALRGAERDAEARTALDELAQGTGPVAERARQLLASMPAR